MSKFFQHVDDAHMLTRMVTTWAMIRIGEMFA